MGRRTMRGLLATCLILLSVRLYGCKSEEVTTSWSNQTCQVDGKIDDWMEYPSKYYDDQAAALSLRSDDKNLYILFRFKDEQWARTIRMSGLTIWIDRDGNKSKKLGIRYTGGPEGLAGPGGPGGREGSMPGRSRESMPQSMKPPEEALVFFDESRILEVSVPLNGERGPAARCDTSMGFYAYEFRIPLSDTIVRSYGLGATPGQKLGMGAMWGHMSAATDKGRPSGGRGGMGGGPPGGGRGGGMGGPPDGMQRPDVPEKQEVWFKTVLATPTGLEQTDLES